MSDKKHIDRLFQEAFNDFEEKPKNQRCDGIQNKINGKNPKIRFGKEFKINLKPKKKQKRH
jgi:hypothetical protein